MNNNMLNKILLKPRFRIELKEKPDFIISKFKEKLEQKNCEFSSKIRGNHFFIDIPKSKQKIWSPQLELVIEKSDKGSSIRGLFAPKPTIWTFFMFLHFVIAIGFLIFFALFYANNITENNPKIWMFAMISMIFLWFLLYFLGQIGKKKAKFQMNQLKQFLTNSLENFN